ncbi:MAG: hypothetical protein K6C13_10040 [Oscillospiraceae bacterium]|nr:hypothetical protein [Oscillospiraceae bacterium]
MDRFEVVFKLFNGKECSFVVDSLNRDTAIHKATLLHWVNFPHDVPDYAVIEVVRVLWVKK